MNRLLYTVSAILFTICAFAQKIKIDKGEIILDNKTVGYIEGKRPVFKIYNLDKSYVFTAELKSVPNEQTLTLPWVELKSEMTGKANEIEFKSRKYSAFNISGDRNIAYELLDKNYLNAEGLNSEAIEQFINGEPTGISAKRLGNQNDINTANNLADTYQLTIDDAGIIYSIKAQNPDPNDKKIGYIKMTSPSVNGELKYEVSDLEGNLIATWFARSGSFSGYGKFLNQEMITFDRKVFKAEFDNRGNPTGYKISKDITAMNIARKLVGNGYPLGHLNN